METIISYKVTIIKFDKQEKETPVSISRTKEGTYRVDAKYNDKKYYLGRMKSMEEAESLKEEAKKRMREGSFEVWLVERKATE